MIELITRRVAQQIFVLVGLSVLVFLLMVVMPGDVAAGMVVVRGGALNQAEVLKFSQLWGLDQPLYIQYFTYLANVLSGDLGKSMATDRDIASELAYYFPATVELAVGAAILALLIGIPAGILSAVHRNSLFDQFVRVLTLIGVSMPIFWLSILALYLFYYHLGIFPSSQRIALTMEIPSFITGFYFIDTLLVGDIPAFFSVIHHLCLPSFMLGFSAVGWIARIVQASMLSVLSEDYIRTARSKGLTERMTVYGHAFRNALIPTTTAIGLMVGSLMSGAVLTETIFAWPGIGRFAVQSIFYLDRPVVMAIALLVGVVFSITNLIVDILVAVLDPRIRY